MFTRVCRICLSANKPIQELEDQLSEYFHELLHNSSGPKPNCCSGCQESLRSNLKFRNKCRNANQLLKDWEWDKSQQKHPIESLHNLLEASHSDGLKQVNLPKYEKCDQIFIDDDDIKEEIKLESFASEVITFVTKADDNNRNYDFANDKNDDFANDKNDDFGNDKNDDYENNKNDDFGNDDSGDVNDELPLQEVAKKNVRIKSDIIKKTDAQVKKVKIKKDLVKKSKKNVKGSKIVKKVPTVYKLRGEIAKRSEFTQYEVVFDIELFATYAEARRELISRSVSEPYISAPYRCELCYTVYKCDKLLQFHMKWHDPSAGLDHECDVCSMRFTSRNTLLKHKPACHRGKFSCKMCPLVTYQRQAMKSHFQKHQGKIYKCEVCDHVFKHISSYMTHKRLTHTSSHVCVTCARTFVSALGLQTHRQKMHPVCSQSKVDSYCAVHCEPCALTFANRQVYTVHVLNTDTHRDIAHTLKACSVCGLSFEDDAQVKEHRRLSHPRPSAAHRRNAGKKEQFKKKDKNSDVIECKLCGLCGSNNFWLYQHYRTAHPAARYQAAGDREFLCDQCGKGFYNKTVLKEHMYVHSGLKPFHCEQCPAAFRSKQHLKLHEERHGPPSRECPQCGKKFASASNLSNHIRSHGARRYKCDVCAKGFVQFSSLREHIRGVHLQIRAPRTRKQDKLKTFNDKL